MKSNKGFTLIELLAVIVILAIIALIATPTILGVIETARKGSAESSALGFIDAVEKQAAIDMLEQDKTKHGLVITSGQLTSTNSTYFSVKGTAPSKYVINIDELTGIISNSCMIVEMSGKKYTVQYTANNGKATATATPDATSCTVPTESANEEEASE